MLSSLVLLALLNLAADGCTDLVLLSGDLYLEMYLILGTCEPA